MRTSPVAGRVHLVVSGTKSRSHLVHIAAYVRSLLEAPGITGVTVSFLPAGAFLSAPAVRAADLQAMLPEDERLTVTEGLPGMRFEPAAHAEYVAVGAPGISTLLALRRAEPRRRFAVVVTDEGIGTYGSVATRVAALRRQGADAPRAAARALLVTGVAAVCTSRRWAAYVRDHGTWTVSEAIAAEFRRGTREVQPGSSRDVVVLTQPFVDLGVLAPEVQLRYVDELFDAARSAGLNPVLRPHPAEDVSLYGDRPVMAARGTADLDPDVIGAALIVGGPSTALVNASAMHGAPVLWVSIPGLEHLDTQVSRHQAEIFRTFLGRPIPLTQAGAAVRAAARTAAD